MFTVNFRDVFVLVKFRTNFFSESQRFNVFKTTFGFEIDQGFVKLWAVKKKKEKKFIAHKYI